MANISTTLAVVTGGCSCFLLLLLSTVSGESVLTRLRNDVMSQSMYDSGKRPVRNNSHVVDVWLLVKLKSMLHVSAQEQRVRIQAYMTEYWIDELLAWDPKYYDNVTTLRFPIDDLWKPDTYVLSNLEMDPANTEREFSLRVELDTKHNRSRVRNSYAAILNTYCKAQVRDFPLDFINCTWTFTSWTYPIQQVNYFFPHEPVQIKHLTQNLEWELKRVIAWRKQSEFNDTPVQYPSLNVEMTIARRPKYRMVTLVLPTLIIVQITLVGIFSLNEATGVRGEKVSMGLASIMALQVLLVVVGDALPKSSRPIPNFTVYALAQLLLSMVALCVSTIIVYTHRNILMGSHPLSTSYAKVVEKMKHMFGGQKKEKLTSTENARSKAAPKRRKRGNTAMMALEFHRRYQRKSPHMADSVIGQEGLLGDLDSIQSTLGESIKLMVRDKAKEEERKKYWRFFLINVELLLLVVFSVFSWFLAGYLFVLPYWKQQLKEHECDEGDTTHFCETGK